MMLKRELYIIRNKNLPYEPFEGLGMAILAPNVGMLGVKTPCNCMFGNMTFNGVCYWVPMLDIVDLVCHDQGVRQW